MSSNTLKAVFIRGGTSKGLFIKKSELPNNRKERDKLLLSVMGSPDPSGLQLNGMGGGSSSTSKVAIISQSNRPGIDVDYLFGQVALTAAVIDWSGSCGNLMAAVGLYAIHEKLAPFNDGAETTIRCWQENLGHEFHLTIPKPNPHSVVSIPGVPGKANPIEVKFINPTQGASLLLENKPIHQLRLPNGSLLAASIILGANPTIFIRAKDIGLTGDELPNSELYRRLEHTMSHLIHMGAKIAKIPVSSVIRVAWLAEPSDYSALDGNKVEQSAFDISSRICTEGRIHHAHTGTGAINLACAANIPGTIPNQILGKMKKTVRIGHPAGVMAVNATVRDENNAWVAIEAAFIRTAKIIMIGEVYPAA